MKKSFSQESRKKLQKMMLEVFTSEIQTLTPELQNILADDMVTALQNRLLVFQNIQNQKSWNGTYNQRYKQESTRRKAYAYQQSNSIKIKF